jgi:hypothetical protein
LWLWIDSLKVAVTRFFFRAMTAAFSIFLDEVVFDCPIGSHVWIL